jgi:hypothetical protein
MFLTTNRIEAFDTAFKSRIHLSIKYPALSSDSRKELWMTFLTNDLARSRPDWMSDTFLDRLSAEPLNGRQIKNIVRTAYSLAVADGSDIRRRDIEISLKSRRDFEEEFHTGAGTAVNLDALVDDDSATVPNRNKRRRQ